MPPIWGWGWFWVSTWTWTCWTSSWVHGVVGGVGCFCLCCGERNWCMYGCSRATRVRWWSPRLSEDPIPLCWLCAKIAMFTAPPSVQYQIVQFFRINNQRSSVTTLSITSLISFMGLGGRCLGGLRFWEKQINKLKCPN